MEKLFNKAPQIAVQVENRLPDLTLGIIPNVVAPTLHGLYFGSPNEDNISEMGIVLLKWEAVMSHNTSRLASLLIHELIHSIQGSELDAVAYSLHLFPDHTPRPSKKALAMFRRNKTGTFVKYNPRSGIVRNKCAGKILTRFPKG